MTEDSVTDVEVGMRLVMMGNVVDGYRFWESKLINFAFDDEWKGKWELW